MSCMSVSPIIVCMCVHVQEGPSTSGGASSKKESELVYEGPVTRVTGMIPPSCSKLGWNRRLLVDCSSEYWSLHWYDQGEISDMIKVRSLIWSRWDLWYRSRWNLCFIHSTGTWWGGSKTPFWYEDCLSGCLRHCECVWMYLQALWVFVSFFPNVGFFCWVPFLWQRLVH